LSKSSPRPRLRPVHRCPVDTERARHLGDGLAGGDPVQRLPPLMRGELLRSPEAHTARLGTLPPLSGAGADADQRALELGEPAGLLDGIGDRQPSGFLGRECMSAKNKPRSSRG
jgi:hypothetical protein